MPLFAWFFLDAAAEPNGLAVALPHFSPPGHVHRPESSKVRVRRSAKAKDGMDISFAVASNDVYDAGTLRNTTGALHSNSVNR